MLINTGSFQTALGRTASFKESLQWVHRSEKNVGMVGTESHWLICAWGITVKFSYIQPVPSPYAAQQEAHFSVVPGIITVPYFSRKFVFYSPYSPWNGWKAVWTQSATKTGEGEPRDTAEAGVRGKPARAFVPGRTSVWVSVPLPFLWGVGLSSKSIFYRKPSGSPLLWFYTDPNTFPSWKLSH